MAYPGNSSLSQEIQERILNTFRQTLELAATGKTEEANLGCDFIIRMDPHFTPARTLQERLRAGGEVEVDDLRDEVFGGAAEGAASAASSQGAPPPSPSPESPSPEPPSTPPSAEKETSFADLNELELDVGEEELGPIDLKDEGPQPPSAQELLATLKGYLEKRRFQEVLDLAGEHAALVEREESLQELVASARSRIEAEPYLRSFLDSARQRLEDGDRREAHRLLEKARKLDPAHPELLELSGPDRIGEVDHVELDSGSKPAGDDEPGVEPGSDEGGEDRVAQLLEEGQAAFDRQDFQTAIDAWSRIFLIDIDNEEANRRIDEARRLKAEQDRKVEEAFHSGLEHLEQGRADEARKLFGRVLEMQPGHLAAKDQLERLTGQGVPAAEQAPTAVDELDLDLGEGSGATHSALKEEIFVPPEPETEGAEPEGDFEEPPPGKAAAAGSRPWQAFGLVGGAVLVVALAGGWLLWANWDRFFPNAVDPPPSPGEAVETPRIDPLERARSLREEGRVGAAVAQLRRLPPTDPAFEDAQELIAEWEAADAAADAAASEAAMEGPTPEQLERWDVLIAEARTAYSEREYLLAEDRFSRAAEIAPLEGTARDLHDDTLFQLERLGRELALIEQGEWAMALPSLWRMYERDPTNRDVVRLLVNAYYNLGVRELQRQAPDRALEHFDEALSLRPADGELQRLYLFALTYQERPPDLLYRIYVKYLTLR